METQKILIDLKEYERLLAFVKNFKSEYPLTLYICDEYGDIGYITTDEAVKRILEQKQKLEKQGIELLNRIRELNQRLNKRNWIQKLFEN